MKTYSCVILAVSLVACNRPQPITAPSVVSQPPVAAVVSAPVVVPPTPAPPSAVVPPVVVSPPTRPFVRTDCDYSTLSAIRCYNPSGQTLVLSAAVTSIDNKTLYSKQENVVIPPGTNGYFTLSGCGQLDLFFGPVIGDVRHPDFSAERVYPCELPPPPPPCTVNCVPPPPPPPPVCTTPDFGPWVTFIAPTNNCRTERRTRTLCNGQVEVEFREVCP